MNTRICKPFVLSVLICLLLLTSFLAASMTVAENANSQVDRWNKDVNLTNAQKTAVQTLATSFAQKCDSINLLKTLPFDQREDLKATAHNAYLLSVENLLTSTQKQRLAAKKSERANTLNEKTAQKATQQSTQQSNQ